MVIFDPNWGPVSDSPEQKAWRTWVEEVTNPLVEELRANSIKISHINQLDKDDFPINHRAAEIILNWLEKFESKEIILTILRAVDHCKTQVDGSRLIEKYQATVDKSIRWKITDTVSRNRPLGMEKWLTETLSNRCLTIQEREGLFQAAPYILHVEEAIDLLIAHYHDESIGGQTAVDSASKGLALCNSQRALEFLMNEELLQPSKKNSERNKAIRKLKQ